MSSNSDQEIKKQLKISEYIEECEPYSEIDLSLYPLSDSDIEMITEKAIIHKQCTKLDLHHPHNTLTEKGTDILFNALHNNTVRSYFRNNYVLHT
jgi:5'(3')-deoxyribonucleotidase